jgi:hypothetical protein
MAWCVVPNQYANAQQISLEISPSPALENAQSLSLTNLGIDKEGNGPVLVSIFLENLTNNEIDNLYLEVNIRASRIGNIIELLSDSNRPFSLAPHQSVYATNNDIANERIPGIKEKVSFSGGLTPEGEDFINSLSGSTTLPSDTYSIEMIVFRVTDADGRENLAQAVAEIGAGMAGSFNESDIYLKTPGDVVDGEAEITNPYPQFSWEGHNNVTYRLLVVEQKGQDSPESLLQSAKSSPATNQGGSLLSFENLDMSIEGTSFQFPSSGAQPLEPGKTYYWRVLTDIQSSGDIQEVSSEIWSFTLLNPTDATSAPPITKEVTDVIIRMMGEDQYRRLESQGFTFVSMAYDGQEFTGPAAIAKLEELLRKINDDEIILGGN